MKLTRWHWIAAALIAVLVHAVIFIGVRLPTPGEHAGAAGPQVQVIGSAAQVFGADDRAPEAPARAIPAEEPEKLTDEAGTKAQIAGPEREAEPVTPTPVRQAEAPETVPEAADAAEPIEAQPLASERAQPLSADPTPEAVTAKREPLLPETEDILPPAQRPQPTDAERKRWSRAARTTPRPDRTRGTRKTRSSGEGRGKRKSGARAASSRAGAGPRRSSASPGDVRRYAAMVRARIARNSPSSLGQRGTAIVRFSISPSGGLRSVRLTRSSGHIVLDRASLRSVRRAAPFPRPPRGMSAAQLRFSIPFRFR